MEISQCGGLFFCANKGESEMQHILPNLAVDEDRKAQT